MEPTTFPASSASSIFFIKPIALLFLFVFLLFYFVIFFVSFVLVCVYGSVIAQGTGLPSRTSIYRNCWYLRVHIPPIHTEMLEWDQRKDQMTLVIHNKKGAPINNYIIIDIHKLSEHTRRHIIYVKYKEAWSRSDLYWTFASRLYIYIWNIRTRLKHDKSIAFNEESLTRIGVLNNSSKVLKKVVCNFTSDHYSFVDRHLNVVNIKTSIPNDSFLQCIHIYFWINVTHIATLVFLSETISGE